MAGLTLTPAAAICLLLAMIVCGRQFRETWKAQAPGWQRRAWAWGLPAALSFAVLALVPVVR